VRVVAGELKGRRLTAPAGRDVRPTSDRAREALFSMLGDVSGLDVLDLYAGTGALAIEALSRGAASATLVDTEPGAARANVAALGLGDRADVVSADALSFLRGAGASFDLILCDPPYRLAARLGPELDPLMRARLRPGGSIVVESAARDPLDLGLEPWRERRYGEAVLRIYRLASPR
jgi:16S rRNA (guanine966-N2)-methyltransferase